MNNRREHVVWLIRTCVNVHIFGRCRNSYIAGMDSVAQIVVQNAQGIYYSAVALAALAVAAVVSPTKHQRWHSTVNVLSVIAIGVHILLEYFTSPLHGNKRPQLSARLEQGGREGGGDPVPEPMQAAQTKSDYERAAARNIHQLNTRAGVANTNGIAPARMQLVGQKQRSSVEEPSEFDQRHGARTQSDMRTHMTSGFAFNRLHAEDSTRAGAAANRRETQVLEDRITQGDARIAPQRGPAGIGGINESPAQVHVPIPDGRGLGPAGPTAKAKVRFEDSPTDASEGHAVEDESLAGAFASTQAGAEMDPQQVQDLIKSAGAG